MASMVATQATQATTVICRQDHTVELETMRASQPRRARVTSTHSRQGRAVIHIG
jgi:hypothetical protein